MNMSLALPISLASFEKDIQNALSESDISTDIFLSECTECGVTVQLNRNTHCLCSHCHEAIQVKKSMGIQ